MAKQGIHQQSSYRPEPSMGAGAGHYLPDGSLEMARILDVPPVLAPQVLRGDIRLTPAWAHGGLREDYMRGVSGHIAVACHEGEHDISWCVENKLYASRTSRQAFTLIPATMDGHWNISGPVVVSHVYLTQTRLQDCADELGGSGRVELLVRVAHKDPAVASLLQLLSHEATRGCEASRLFIEQAIDLLCLRIVTQHSAKLVKSPSLKRGLAAWQVKKVITHIREHLSESIGLDDLAGLVGLSRYHFCTAFRLATRHTPYAHLTAERISCACKLLAEQRLSITDIALAVGYATPSSFTAAFRRATGTTPSEYRRRL